MATMRPYSSWTLEGNWREDRLKGGVTGVVPDLGFREYKTTTSDSFIPPNERPEASRLGKKRLRVGLVTPDTLSEAAFSYGNGLPPQQKFDATSTAAAGRSSLASETAAMPKSTTMREALAGPREFSEHAAQKASKEMSALYHSAMAPPAGGGGSLRIDRGKKSLRNLAPGAGNPLVLGEASIDYPQRAVARTPKETLPVDDLGFMSLQVPSALGASETVMLAGPGATHGKFSAFQAAPRIVTDVTQTAKEISMRPGRRVFADE